MIFSKPMINKIKAIQDKLNSNFFYNFDTSKKVWFRAGGKTAVFCEVYNSNELQIILNNVGDMDYKIIGAGSNLLIRDRGYEGILLKLGKNFNQIKKHANFLEVGAGLLDVNLAKFAKQNMIKGFEFYSGIPGTIGGSIKMNSGCFGSETKDILKDVKIINSSKIENSFTKDQLELSYRSSNLSKTDIITSARFYYSHGNSEEIINRINNIKIMRKNSQPIKAKTSGSTFKNPKNSFAAKLIEMSDCKGLNVNDAFVSDKHANFLINTNNASAKDIEELGNRIIDKVYNKFNITLEWEIEIIGN
tara:strand:- start:841 stop:1752 length:912 start_codon:yes stop_codon:yes gene_type:complete